MDNWYLKPYKEILEEIKNECVSFVDFTKIDSNTMSEIEDSLKEIERNARADEAAAMSKAAEMYLSL
jgi:hypothetical protein